MLAQSPAQVPVKYVSVQCKGGLFAVLYGNSHGGSSEAETVSSQPVTQDRLSYRS